MQNESLDISSIARGALLEQADVEIKKILENIADPNTDIKKARKLTITLTFKPTGLKRDSAAVDIQTKSSIIPYNPVTTQVYIGKDNSGNIVAEEYVKGTMVGQQEINTGDQSNKKIVQMNK